MSKLLFEKQWDETKSSLLQGEVLEKNQDGSYNPTKKVTMEVILENTRKNLLENAAVGATSAGNVATLNKVILPVI